MMYQEVIKTQTGAHTGLVIASAKPSAGLLVVAIAARLLVVAVATATRLLVVAVSRHDCVVIEYGCLEEKSVVSLSKR